MVDFLSKVKAALREEDVEGLIKLGAPADEYDSESKEIASAVGALNKNQFTEDNIVAVLALVWTKSFHCLAEDIEKRMTAFHRIARSFL